jgi:hypothetical protein
MNIVYMKKSGDAWAIFLQSSQAKDYFWVTHAHISVLFYFLFILICVNLVNPKTSPGTWK